MKRIVSGILALFMMVAVFNTTASAQYTQDTSASVGIGTASVNAAISIQINGVTYSIPGGAISTVGYGYNNDPIYVYYCQSACNRVYEKTKDKTITWLCYCGVADGIFGPKTHEGILAFQKSNNSFGLLSGWPELAEDGVCGDNTWKRLAAMSD